jgi:dTMP kinase
MPLIVICGTDGSGKGTQVGLLAKRLEKEGFDVLVQDFPRYDEPSSYFVQEYLNGRYGSAKEVGPYRASIFYAVDRYAASFEMKEHLARGGVVFANRYVSANKGHQLGKIKGEAGRDRFLAWLDELEYGTFGIPKEDVNVLLDVPPEVGQRLVDRKGARSYTKRKRDVHEADLRHLKEAAEAYRYVAEKEGWLVVECVRDGRLLSIEEIHELLYGRLKPFFRKV